MTKVAMISLGCAKNLVNSEQMLNLLDEAGFEIVGEAEGADVAVVNTCGFIDSAKMEAIENILNLGELKQAGKLGKIIVTGCLAQRYRSELMDGMPEIDAVLGVGSFDKIVEAVRRVTAGEKYSDYGDIDAPVQEEGRIVTTGPAWAYLRIAEGCDNHCAYCVIPGLRGKFRSRTFENVVNEAQALADSGIREIIVVAQDITRYGTDLYGRRRLAELLREIGKIPSVHWIRLHYLYPEEVDEELIAEIRDNPKVLKYLDIPIQHINDSILKLMNRRGTGEEIEELFVRLRREIPDLVLRTSLIAGLPGEDEAAVEQLCDFLRRARIQRVGVFPFSPEEGTPAAEMEHVDYETAQARADSIMDVQERIMEEYNQSRIGTVTEVLCEGFDEDALMYYGRSFAESPDIDGRILFTGAGLEPGNFYPIHLVTENDGELVGVLNDDIVEE